MIIDKAPYWDKIVEHYYDNVHWEKNYEGIYDWLDQEYTARSATGSSVIDFADDKKVTFFVMRFGS